MASVGFVLHSGHPEAERLYRLSHGFLSGRGVDAFVIGPAGAEGNENPIAIVSIGGDGTMLRSMALGMKLSSPVLGVNLGHLGYLAEVEPEEIKSALECLLDGTFDLDQRIVAEAVVSSTHAKQRYLAVNEIVVERQSSGHVIRGDVYIAGHFFLRYEADGIIVSTPTGSTAYNLSARGPILSPQAIGLALTPLSPHMLFDRSMVLSPQESVEIQLAEGPIASLMVDGAVQCNLHPGERVRITVAKEKVQLIKLVNIPFHQVLKRKFRLSDDPRMRDD